MSDYIHPYMAYYVLVILASSMQFIYLLVISASSVSCELYEHLSRSGVSDLVKNYSIRLYATTLGVYTRSRITGVKFHAKNEGQGSPIR